MRAAFFMWLKAAEKGVAPAAYNVSVMYENGDGTAADPAQSFRWMKEAAELGVGVLELGDGRLARQRPERLERRRHRRERVGFVHHHPDDDLSARHAP